MIKMKTFNAKINEIKSLELELKAKNKKEAEKKIVQLINYIELECKSLNRFKKKDIIIKIKKI